MIPGYSGKIPPGFVEKAMRFYHKYRADLSAFHQKVRENDKWYKCNYGQVVKPGTNEPGPATAFIANAIFNRYADFLDNYPVPNIVEREPEDATTAKKLKDIVPVVLEAANFKKKYKRNCYNKMKNGSGIYGVFFNEETQTADITVIDVLDFYCDCHADDVQESPFVFVRTAMDNDTLKAMYPQFADCFQGSCSIEGREQNYTAEDMTEILDCYYKKIDGTLHLMKLVNESVIIDATEDRDGYKEGLYAHGLFPFVIDNMYPDDDNIFGFSLIDITRNPQMYIDKLDGAILKNAMLSSHPRWLIKDNGGINKKEFADMRNEVVTSAADVDEKNIRMFQVNSLPMFVREHRANKIEELKEIAGNRDWNNGGTSSGVTAASAIQALQASGQKLSRANIDDTYDSYKEIVYMVIELMRQFCTVSKKYRVTGDTGRREFVSFSSDDMYSDTSDMFGCSDGGRRRVEFDVSVVPQKENPFTRETNNQTINALWAGGYFAPENMKLSIIALKCMQFDGRDRLIEMLQGYMDEAEQENNKQQQQVPQAQPVGELTDLGGDSDLMGESELIPVPLTNGGDIDGLQL